MAKITAYRKDTGEKVRIPAHYLTHPTLGEPFTKTPPAEKPAGESPSGGAKTSEAGTSAARKEK